MTNSNGRAQREGGAPPSPLINPRVPHVPLTQCFERVNRHGRRYLVGRLGTAKLIIVPTTEVSRGEPIWKVFLGEGPYASENSTALVQGVDEMASR